MTSVDLYPSALPKVGPMPATASSRSSRASRTFPLRTILREIRQREQTGDDMIDPIVVRPEAPAPLVTYLQERASQFPGVSLGQTYVRRYPHGDLAAQLFGIVGPITPQESKMTAYQDFRSATRSGSRGSRPRSTPTCRAIDGAARVRVDSFGQRRSRRALVKAATPGQTVR